MKSAVEDHRVPRSKAEAFDNEPRPKAAIVERSRGYNRQPRILEKQQRRGIWLTRGIRDPQK